MDAGALETLSDAGGVEELRLGGNPGLLTSELSVMSLCVWVGRLGRELRVLSLRDVGLTDCLLHRFSLWLGEKERGRFCRSSCLP